MVLTRHFQNTAVLVIAFAGGLYWSWGKWPDTIVDFGRELYVPWRLVTGAVLYRDVAHFNGPFSPYFNAMLFRLFGTSILTLVIANGAILLAVLVMVYQANSCLVSHGAALLAGLILLVVFAFGQLEMTGNSNWLCPYAHEITHGLALTLLSLLLLQGWVRRRRLGWAASAGFVLGLVFLTKPELFVAALAAHMSALVLIGCLERRVWPSIAIWTTMAVVAPAAAMALLSFAMPATEALRGTLGSWVHVLNSELTGLVYYQRVMGVDDIRGNLVSLCLWTGGYGLLVGAMVAAAVIGRRGGDRITLRTSVGLVFAVGSAVGLMNLPWREMARPWPLGMVLLLLAGGWALFRTRADPDARRQWVLRLSWAVLGFFLLLKMILHTRIMHYGFTLALPATLLMVVSVWHWVPIMLSRLGCHRTIFRAALFGTCLGVMAVHVQATQRYYAAKQYPVGRGPDSFLADSRGGLISDALQRIERLVKPGETMVVFPEGPMLNYLARVPGSTPFVQFIPPEISMYGENTMLRTLQAHPPDWVVLVNRDDSEYGFRFFGRDYGRELARWIIQNYQRRLLVGPEPFQNASFGILIARRLEDAGR